MTLQEAAGLFNEIKQESREQPVTLAVGSVKLLFVILILNPNLIAFQLQLFLCRAA